MIVPASSYRSLFRLARRPPPFPQPYNTDFTARNHLSLPMSSAPQIPRPSASVAIVNARNEVLLVHRNPKSSAFAGVHVFPGGNLDQQDSSIAMTAIRETFEEAGLLLAQKNPGSASALENASVLDVARHAIHNQNTTFQSFLDEHGLIPDTAAMLPFTSWVTPVDAPRRFHTQFFVTFLPSAFSTGFSSGDKEDVIPTPDGGKEVISARFVHPKAALQEFRERKITMMPPQFYILTTLSSILTDNQNTAEQRALVQRLSSGMFGRMTINPRKMNFDKSGRGILTYEGDETRGGRKGRLHRAVVKTRKGGITEEITLHRNFDIFTEIEAHWSQESAKL